MNGSRHPMPLVTVYHHLQPIAAPPCTFLQAVFGYKYSVGLLDEEKILPVGKDITVVGMCRLSNGTPEIKSCKDLPFFMSDMTKEEMLADLAFKTKIFLWGGVVCGSIAIGVLVYAAVRNWNKWNEWRQMRRIQQENPDDNSEADTQIVTDEETGDILEGELCTDEETGDIPEGELCAICLARS